MPARADGTLATVAPPASSSECIPWISAAVLPPRLVLAAAGLHSLQSGPDDEQPLALPRVAPCGIASPLASSYCAVLHCQPESGCRSLTHSLSRASAAATRQPARDPPGIISTSYQYYYYCRFSFFACPDLPNGPPPATAPRVLAASPESA